MYEEDNRKIKIGWITPLLKILGAIIFIIVIYLGASKLIKNKDDLPKDNIDTTTFVAKINEMKQVALEYYTTDNLPKEINETSKLTLNDIFEKKLMIDFTENGKKCDLSESYIETTKNAEGKYNLMVNLVCNNKSDYIITKIEKEISKNDNVNTENKDNQIANNSNATPSSNNGNNNNNTNNNVNTNNKNNKVTTTIKTTVKVNVTCGWCNNNSTDNNKKTLYYQFVKYGAWEYGKLEKVNIENKELNKVTTYNYCLNNLNTIYTTCSITSNKAKTYNQTLNLSQFIQNSNNDLKVIEHSQNYFNDNDYQTYINNQIKNLSIYNPNLKITDANTFKKASLNKNNFTFEVGQVYQKDNNYYVDIKLNVLDTNGITPYHDNNLGYPIYYIPLKFNVTSSSSSCIRDTEDNAYKYVNKGYNATDPVTVSTWQHRTVEYTYSTQKELDGWQFTGVTEYR